MLSLPRVLLRSPLLWHQHLINIDKISLITFQGKMQLPHLKDGKLRHTKKPPKETNQPKTRFAFSAIFKSLHVCPERSKSGRKPQFLRPRPDNGVSFRAVTALQKCRKQREPAALARPSRSTGLQTPPMSSSTLDAPAPPKPLGSGAGRMPRRAAACERSGLSLYRCICTGWRKPKENRSGRRDPLWKALVPQVSLSGPRNK